MKTLKQQLIKMFRFVEPLSPVEKELIQKIINATGEWLELKRQLNNDKYANEVSDYNLGKMEEDTELVEELKE